MSTRSLRRQVEQLRQAASLRQPAVLSVTERAVRVCDLLVRVARRQPSGADLAGRLEALRPVLASDKGRAREFALSIRDAWRQYRESQFHLPR